MTSQTNAPTSSNNTTSTTSTITRSCTSFLGIRSDDDGLVTGLLMGLAGSAVTVALVVAYSSYALPSSSSSSLSSLASWSRSFTNQRHKTDLESCESKKGNGEQEKATQKKTQSSFSNSHPITGRSLMTTTVNISTNSPTHNNQQDSNTEETRPDMEKERLKFEVPSHIQREMLKEERRKAKLKDLSIKKPMYDNVTMLDPQGDILCKISMRKACWYIRKGLATWISTTENTDTNNNNDEEHTPNNPPTIQISFEPKRRVTSPSSKSTKSSQNQNVETFVLSNKRNACVVCNATQHHMRHYIVPHVYRALLPEKYKLHLSHDVVPLCHRCHVEYDRFRQERMRSMEDVLRNAGKKNTKGGKNREEKDNSKEAYFVDRKLYHVRSCALALMNHGDKLPREKRMQHEATVRHHLGLSRSGEDEEREEGGCSSDENGDMAEQVPLTKEQLQEAIDVEYKKPNSNYIPGPVLMVNALLGKNQSGNHDQHQPAMEQEEEEEIMTDFVRGWRLHFLQTMEPRYMPEGWSVESPIVCGGF